LLAGVTRVIGTTVSTPDENVMIVNASAGSSCSISCDAAAFALRIGSPFIEPERSSTTASESGGRATSGPGGIVIETARVCSPRWIWLEVSLALITMPSSPPSTMGIGGGAWVRGDRRSAATTAAPAPRTARDVRM